MQKTPKNKPVYNQLVLPVQPIDINRIAHKVLNFSVTTDSVVATIHMTVDDKHSVIKIYWGDESDNNGPQVIDLRKERMFAGENLNPNVVNVQHAYDDLTIRRYIVVEIVDSQGHSNWESAVIDLIPRYKFIVYPIHLEIHGHLDTDFETHSEFDVVITVYHRDEVVYSKLWQPSIRTFLNIPNQYPVLYKLEGSEINLEMTYDDYPVQIRTYVKEKDNPVKNFFKWVRDTFTAEFDGSVPAGPYDGGPFHPRKFKGYKEIKFSEYQQDTSVYTVFRTEINLIVPLVVNSEQVLAPIH